MKLILLIFIIITFVQAIFIWMKWQDIQDYHQLGISAAGLLNVDRTSIYIKFLKLMSWILTMLKRFIIVPICILLFINFILSLVLGGLLSIFI